jgi:hypothetical protein
MDFYIESKEDEKEPTPFFITPDEFFSCIAAPNGTIDNTFLRLLLQLEVTKVQVIETMNLVCLDGRLEETIFFNELFSSMLSSQMSFFENREDAITLLKQVILYEKETEK